MSLEFFDPAPTALKFRKGFDNEPEYQMIPLGGTRDVGLHIFLDEPTDVFVFVNDRSKAVIRSFFTTRGSAPVAVGDGLVFKKDSQVLLTIAGIGSGRTKIVVEPVNGGRQRFCRLSIKPKRPVTYQLGIISDAVRPPDFERYVNRASSGLLDNMAGAERIWLSHANVELRRVGPINSVKVPWDIGEHIFVDDPIVRALIIHSSLTRDFAQAHMYIYHSWDVVYHDKNPGGSTTDNLCFVEDWVGRIGELVCAHEVGHALGLDHPPTTEPSLLMTAQSIADERLLAGQIEIANPL